MNNPRTRCAGAARTPRAALALLLVFVSDAILAQSPQSFFEYDASGNRTQATDALAHSRTSAYDALDRLIQSTDATGAQIRYQYDALDRLLRVTDPRALATTYSFDGLGNLTAQSSPDTGTTRYSYDAAGNLASRTDARGQTLTYSYDALNRLTRLASSDATTTYSYDEGANGSGRLTGTAGPMGQATRWAYDAHGRVTVKRQSFANAAFTLGYAYDEAGRLMSLTYPSGKRLDYHYDGQGRIAGLDVDGVPQLTGIGYLPFGPAQSWRWGNGSAYRRSFDTDGRLTAHPLGAATRHLTYDGASRLTQLDEGSPASTRSYGYDAADRLTQAVLPSSAYAYRYDASGNRTSLGVGGVVYPYSLEAGSNRLAAVAGPQPQSRRHDAAGNLVFDGTYSYSYRGDGRLTAVTAGGYTHRFDYDGLGQRVVKRNGQSGQWTFYVYDEQGRLLGEYDPFGAPLQETVYLAETPVLVMKRQAGELLLDNGSYGQTSSTGSWQSGATTLGYQGWSYLWHAAGSAASYRWSPAIAAARPYRLYARWVAEPANAPDATYTIAHAEGSSTVAVDQRINGGQFVYLGTYLLGADPSQHSITLTDSPRGTVVADAIRLVPADASPQAYFIHADHLDTPRVILDSLNRPLWRWESDPFGMVPPDENPSGLGSFTYNLRFPGQVFDQETNLHYNMFREYEPGTGRYVESDPIGLAVGINTYAYVDGNPISRKDLMGQDWKEWLTGRILTAPLKKLLEVPGTEQGELCSLAISCERYKSAGGEAAIVEQCLSSTRDPVSTRGLLSGPFVTCQPQCKKRLEERCTQCDT